MRILIDINHPAHVHLFKNVAHALIENGDEVFFTTRRKEISHLLLETTGMPYKILGNHYQSKAGKVYGIFKYDLLLLIEALRFKPDMFLSMGSIYASHVSFLLKKPNILLQDTENAKLQHRLSYPFADAILNPKCYRDYEGHKQFRYDGYHELAYLHPKRFTPDPGELVPLGVRPGEIYTIVRFVSWNANHDFSHRGLTDQEKISAVEAFSKYGKVFITSEAPLPKELEPYRIRTRIDRIHHIMAFASLLYGESATMASECAILGVPSIYINNQRLGYLDELQKEFDLVYNYSDTPEQKVLALNQGIEVLRGWNKAEWLARRDKMLRERIDLTGFLYWFIQNFPQSMETLRTDPVAQNRFKR